MAIATSVYNCGYKGPLYMPHNNEASKPVATNNGIPIKVNESKISESNVKIIKQNESSTKINSRSYLNESN